METASAAARLKSIREATGLSLQKVADRMNMKLSSYRHYEERFKGASLPAETVEKLLVAFADFPDAQEDIRPNQRARPIARHVRNWRTIAWTAPCG